MIAHLRCNAPEQVISGECRGNFRDNKKCSRIAIVISSQGVLPIWIDPRNGLTTALFYIPVNMEDKLWKRKNRAT